MKKLVLIVLFAAGIAASPAIANTPFSFSTGSPDGRIGLASRPDVPPGNEIEAADDFIINSQTQITSATFTGLLSTGLPLGDINQVVVEIYRVFPIDSDLGRTSGAPTFSTVNVPTRVNSPSDVAFDSRNSLSGGGLNFSASVLNPSFTAANSILDGIHPKPNQTTGGEGPVTGQEVRFDVTFTHPFNLPGDHYFFVPQVELSSGDFFWLSAPRPITTGTPFVPDLQAWIRNGALDPDWLRAGTDIVGGNPAPTFNAAFSLAGNVPDSGSTALLLGSAAAVLLYLRRRSQA